VAFNYASLVVTAASVLAQFGKMVTLRQVTDGAYDPATGLNTTVTTDKLRKGAFFDFPVSQERGAGGEVLATDKQMIMEAGTVPRIQDKIIDGATEYVIIGFAETNPAGTPVIYTLHLRR